MLKLLIGWSGSESDFELTKLKASHQTADAHDRRGELRRKLWRRIASRLAASHSSGFSVYSHQSQFHAFFTELPNARANQIYEKEAAISEQNSAALQPQAHPRQRAQQTHAVEDRHSGGER